MRWRGFSETAYCNLTWQYDESKYLVADQASWAEEVVAEQAVRLIMLENIKEKIK